MVKTVGFCGVMVLITFLVALVYTDDITVAVNIGLVTNVVKTGTYDGYERLWDRITRGLQAGDGAVD